MLSIFGNYFSGNFVKDIVWYMYRWVGGFHHFTINIWMGCTINPSVEIISKDNILISFQRININIHVT